MYLHKIFRNIKKEYKKHAFSDLSFNSKTCKNGSIFFAIKGKNYDGNKFIEEAIARGAKTIINICKLKIFLYNQCLLVKGRTKIQPFWSVF